MTAQYIKRNMGYSGRVHVLGSNAVVSELENAGLTVVGKVWLVCDLVHKMSKMQITLGFRVI